jgi:type IV secretion system protein VirB10
MGKYEAVSRGGQSRIEVVWYRLIFPDTTNIDLQKMLGADVEGGAGLEGITDNHWGDILHAALLSSILAVGIAETTPQQVSIITEPTAGQIVAQTVGHNVSDVGNRIVQRELNRPPTIHIKRGYPFNVVVDRDISFDAPYTPQL